MNYVIIKKSNYYNTIDNLFNKSISSRKIISNVKYFDTIRNVRMCSFLTFRNKYFEMWYFNFIRNNEKVKIKIRKEK